jgi:hypothetical protein
VICCGTQKNVLLLVYDTTIIHIQNQGRGVFGGMDLYHATCLEDAPISYDQSLLKGFLAITIERISSNHY